MRKPPAHGQQAAYRYPGAVDEGLPSRTRCRGKKRDANDVVAFRDQHLSNEKHVEFRRRFGELEVHIVKKYLLPDYPEILMISLSVTKRVNKLVSPMPIHLAQRGVLPKGS